MQLLTQPSNLILLLTITVGSILPASAKPIRDYLDARDVSNSTIAKRCDNPCGYSGQLCCAVGQICYTDSANQAQCGDAGPITAAGGSGGYWQTYTSTWIDTSYSTRTAVFTAYVGGSATAAATPTASCDYAANESPCGDICCSSGEYCARNGVCKDAGNGGRTTTGLGGSFVPPLRPTTGTISVSTATVSASTTVPFGTPVATGANVTITGEESSGGGGGGGLSGGAIAGIVIGVLIGIALLLLLCFCCIARGLWAIVAGIFGWNNKKRKRVEETTYISEHHHHGSAAGSRRWYGDRPSRRSRSPEKKSRFGWAAAGLGALGLGLAGKKALDKRRARRDEKSDISSSYYSYSDYYSYTSPSSASSDDRRTRRSSRRGSVRR